MFFDSIVPKAFNFAGNGTRIIKVLLILFNRSFLITKFISKLNIKILNKH